MDLLPVLVVDDDPASAKLMSVVLSDAGCVVWVATSAEQALIALARFHPVAIVLDLVLPMMSGLLLAQQLKANPATRGIVIIAVSAFNGDETRQMVLDVGCADYVRKPIDPLTFARVLRSHLGGKS